MRNLILIDIEGKLSTQICLQAKLPVNRSTAVTGIELEQQLVSNEINQQYEFYSIKKRIIYLESGSSEIQICIYNPGDNIVNSPNSSFKTELICNIDIVSRSLTGKYYISHKILKVYYILISYADKVFNHTIEICGKITKGYTRKCKVQNFILTLI